MKKKVLGLSSLTILILILMQVCFFGGFNKVTFESLVINFMTEIMGVVFTFYVIDLLLSKHEESVKYTFVNETIKNEYIQLITRICLMYITFVTKNPPQQTVDLDTIDKLTENTVDNLNKYVHSNFVRANIKTMKPVMKDGFPEGVMVNVTYQEYNLQFKQFTKDIIDKFLVKYLVKIPDDVVNNLSNINNLLLHNMLVTPLDKGIVMDISNAEFSTEEMKKPLKEIGDCLITLNKIIK